MCCECRVMKKCAGNHLSLSHLSTLARWTWLEKTFYHCSGCSEDSTTTIRGFACKVSSGRLYKETTSKSGDHERKTQTLCIPSSNGFTKLSLVDSTCQKSKVRTQESLVGESLLCEIAIVTDNIGRKN